MATVFYDHLIPWHKVEAFIVSVQPTAEEKWELIEIIEETVHTEVLTLVLSHLPETTHAEFLERFHAAPHQEEHLHFLRSQNTVDVEATIAAAMDLFIEDLLSSLQSPDESSPEDVGSVA